MPILIKFGNIGIDDKFGANKFLPSIYLMLYVVKLGDNNFTVLNCKLMLTVKNSEL